jgi:hypothetical protein
VPLRIQLDEVVRLPVAVARHSLGDSTIALRLAGPTTSTSSEQDDCSEGE